MDEKKQKFRYLTAEEIDVRVAMCKPNGVSLLLYKDARCDMRILDETFGCTGWQRSHQLIGDRLYCTIEIWDDVKKQWISKQDVGTESNTEKEKGQASDSFKRAAFNVGIGRELYTAPFIWINKDKCEIKESGRKDNYGKPIMICNDKFAVEQIITEDGVIVALSIKNATSNKRVFIHDIRKKPEKK